MHSDNMFEIFYDDIKICISIVSPVFANKLSMLRFEFVNKEPIRIQTIQTNTQLLDS